MGFFDNYKKIKDKQNLQTGREELNEKMKMLGIFARYGKKSGIVDFKDINSKNKKTALHASKALINILYNMFMERLNTNPILMNFLHPSLNSPDKTEYAPFVGNEMMGDESDNIYLITLGLPEWYYNYYFPFYFSENLEVDKDLANFCLGFLKFNIANKYSAITNLEKGTVAFLVTSPLYFSEHLINAEGIKEIKKMKHGSTEYKALKKLNFFQMADFFNNSFRKKFHWKDKKSELYDYNSFFLSDNSGINLNSRKLHIDDIKKQLAATDFNCCDNSIDFDKLVSRIEKFMHSSYIFYESSSPLSFRLFLYPDIAIKPEEITSEIIHIIEKNFYKIYSYMFCPNFVRLKNLACYLMTFMHYSELSESIVMDSSSNMISAISAAPLHVPKSIDINEFIELLFIYYPFKEDLLGKDTTEYNDFMQWIDKDNPLALKFNENKILCFQTVEVKKQDNTRYHFKYNTSNHQKENLEILEGLLKDNGLLFNSIDEFSRNCPANIRQIKIPCYKENEMEKPDTDKEYINTWYSDYEDFNIEALTSHFIFLNNKKQAVMPINVRRKFENSRNKVFTEPTSSNKKI